MPSDEASGFYDIDAKERAALLAAISDVKSVPDAKRILGTPDLTYRLPSEPERRYRYFGTAKTVLVEFLQSNESDFHFLLISKLRKCERHMLFDDLSSDGRRRKCVHCGATSEESNGS